MSKVKKHVHNNVKNKQKAKNKIIDISFLFFLITVVVIPNVYYKPALDKHLDVRLFAIALFLLFLGILIILNKKKSNYFADFSILKKPVFILYFSYFIIVSSSVLWATNRSEAVYEILKTGTFLLVFLYTFLFVIPKEKSKETFITSFIILGLIISITGLVQYKGAVEELGFGVNTAYKVIGNFAHKNIFSQILFLTFTFSLYGIYLFKDFRQKFAIISTFLSFLMILVLMTRSVWTALIASSLVISVVYFLFLKKELPLKSLRKWLISIGVVIGISVTLFILFSGFDSKKEIQTHIVEATKFKEGNVVHRLDLWKKSIPLVKDNPIFGVGVGNWKIDILKYDVTISNGKQNIVPRRTHNDYISILTESGFVGLFIYLSFLGLVFLSVIQLIKKSDNNTDRLFNLSLLFAFVGYSTYSFFSFPKERIETQILFNIVLAFIVQGSYVIAPNKTNKVKKNNLFKPIVGLAVIFLFFATLSGFYRTRSEAKINKLFSLRKTTNYDQMYQLAEEAISPFSQLTPFSQPIAKIQAGLLFQQKKSTDEIIAKYEEALEVLPYHVKTLLELAQVYVSMEDYETAISYTEKAYEYAPSNLNVLIVHVYFLKQAGRGDEAYEILRSISPYQKDQRYKDLTYSFLNEKAINFANSVDIQAVRQKLYEESQSKDGLLKMFTDAYDNNTEFEKVLLENVLNQVNTNNSLIIDSSLNVLIEKYNVELESVNQ